MTLPHRHRPRPHFELFEHALTQLGGLTPAQVALLDHPALRPHRMVWGVAQRAPAASAAAGWDPSLLVDPERRLQEVLDLFTVRGLRSSGFLTDILWNLLLGDVLDPYQVRDYDLLEVVASAHWADDLALVRLFLESVDNLGLLGAAALVDAL